MAVAVVPLGSVVGALILYGLGAALGAHRLRAIADRLPLVDPTDIDATVDRLAGLRRIGIDEISYKRGHRYLTVVVDHDTGRLVWAKAGHNRATLQEFFDLLGPERHLDRVVDALPGELREQTKSFLAQSLKAVVTQVLVKTPDGRGRKAVLEILINNRAIAKLITSDQSHQIPAQLQTGRDVGMQLMDQALFAAIEAGEVDPDDAFRYASDKRKFKRFVTDTGILPTLDMED